MTKYCKGCGKELADTAQFCDGCGTSYTENDQSANQQEAPNQQYAQPNDQYGQNQQYAQPNDQYAQNQQYGQQVPPNQPFQGEEVYSPEDIAKNKTMAGLAYLIFFLPLIACPESRYARFHANQALLVFLLGVAAGVINIIPLLGCVISVVAYIFSVVLFILGMVNGFSGKAKELPLIGKIKIIK